MLNLHRSIKEERVREEEEATQAQEAHKNATREGEERPPDYAGKMPPVLSAMVCVLYVVP
jgi:hypothetical protein